MDDKDLYAGMRILISIAEHEGNYRPNEEEAQADRFNRGMYKIALKDIAADVWRHHGEPEAAQAAVDEWCSKLRREPEFVDHPEVMQGFLFARYERDIRDAIDGLAGRHPLIQEWAVRTSLVPGWVKIILWGVLLVVLTAVALIVLLVLSVLGGVIAGLLSGAI